LIPKPGKWMENLKILLGFLLLVTFSWLLNVIGISYVLNITIFFTILLLSLLINKSINRLILVVIISLSILATILLVPKDKGKIEWENFNETLLDEYLDRGDLIFLDFTADWCITCQVNKFTTLENKKVKRYFLENNVKLLRADWTNKDDKILGFIKKYERFGVPLNIIYSRNMTEGYILPEILSKTIVIKNLDRIKDE
jgi:thiol:disulfide interchange protein